MIKYSVIVPTYNRAALLKKNLEALARQNISSKEYEIILVNDGSQDHTDNVVASFRERCPEINLIYVKQENRGVACARNAGIHKAQGKFLFFTDDDCVVPEGWIQTLAGAYRRHPDIAGVGGWYEYPEDVYRSSVYVRYTASRLQKAYQAHSERASSGEVKSNWFFNNLSGNTSNMSYRKSVLEETHGFDETLRFVGRVDWELKKRISDLGYPLLYIPYYVLHLKPLGFREVIRKFFNFGRGSYHLVAKNRELASWYRPTFSKYIYKIRDDYTPGISFALLALVELFFARLGWAYQKYIKKTETRWSSYPVEYARTIELIEHVLSECTQERIVLEEKYALDKISQRRADIFREFSGQKITKNIYQDGPHLRHAPAFEGERPLRKETYDLADHISYMSVPHQYGMFLFFLVRRLGIKRVLELGTGFGISTLYLLKALEDRTGGFVDSIEREDLPFQYYHRIFADIDTSMYTVHHGDIRTVLPQLQNNRMPYDFVFIDAGHTANELRRNVEAVFEIIPRGGVVVVDDIRWSPQMIDTWQGLTSMGTVVYATTYRAPEDSKTIGRMGLLLK